MNRNGAKMTFRSNPVPLRMGLHHPKTQPCRAIACWALFPTCIWKLAFDSFQLLLRQTVSHGGWRIHWIYSERAKKKVQCSVKIHMSKPSSICIKRPSKQRPHRYAVVCHKCKDCKVADLLWCQGCNPGSHRKRDWNMMRLNSPSLICVSIVYIIFFSCCIQRSSISVPILNFLKPLVYLHSKFPVTTWTSNCWRSILCSRRPPQNVFKKAFPGNEARP